jgi:hypothetical protein
MPYEAVTAQLDWAEVVAARVGSDKEPAKVVARVMSN